MKNKITSIILAIALCIPSAVTSYAAVSAVDAPGDENQNTWESNLDIPNLSDIGTAYDPDGFLEIAVLYASAQDDGRLTVTVTRDIDVMEVGSSVVAAVIDGEYGYKAENRDAGVEEHITPGYYDDGFEYICAGSYYILAPGTYYLFNVAASEACYLVVGDSSSEGEFGESNNEPAYDDSYTGVSSDGQEFIPGNGVENDVIATPQGYRFEIRFPIAGSNSYWINGGTVLHTEYLVWPECELILPDNGESYELYSILHVSDMGDTYEGGCTLYGGDSICFTDDRLSHDADGTYYGDDYTVTLITEQGDEVYFRVVLNDITAYIPDYYDDSSEGWYDPSEMYPDEEYTEDTSGISFTDVAAGEWYHDTVIAAAKAGIIAGNSDGTYNPNGELTWAQAITFAVRLDQYLNGNRPYGAEDQTGVWYQIYVDYALNCGIITYVPENTGYVINRAEAAVIFAAVLNTNQAVNDVPAGFFSDIPESGEVYDAVYRLARAGICNGVGNGSFGAETSFKRSQVAAIVARMACLVDPVIIG